MNDYFFTILKKIQKIPFLPKYVILAFDIANVTCCYFLSLYVSYALMYEKAAFNAFFVKLPVCVLVSGFFFYLFNTFSEYIRFSSFKTIMRIFMALFCIHVCLLAIFRTFPVFLNYSRFGLAESLFGFLLSAFIIYFIRTGVRVVNDYMLRKVMKAKGIPLLIYGIDSVHIGIAKMIRLDDRFPYTVVGFIAYKPIPRRYQILGSNVYSSEDVFNEVIVNKGIKTILVRAEDLQSETKKALFRKFIEHKFNLLSMPSIENVNDIRKIRKVNIEDLLGRSPIKTDLASIGRNMKGKTVMVTGAAGSIGGEIVRQLCKFELDKLLMVDIAETPLHNLSLELNGSTLITYIPFVSDVRNKNKMKGIFERYKPHYIYHAAAYKHVPLMEQYPSEAVFTNVMGTKIIADLAVTFDAECFVMISTDKAVNPTNVMGASKRIAEMYIQSKSGALKKAPNVSSPPVRFITTRFGNVLGSNGSVIPTFARQITNGGPITVTHPDIVRYFMTIPEACSLVLEAGNMGKGGEVFVFDMGEMVKIKDLAEEMIRLSGLEPYKDIDIVYTGLRPGEKLHEELLHRNEHAKTLQNEKIMIGNVREYSYEQVSFWLEKLLHTARTSNEREVVTIMKEMVPEYISNNSEYTQLDKIKANNTINGDMVSYIPPSLSLNGVAKLDLASPDSQSTQNGAVISNPTPPDPRSKHTIPTSLNYDI